MKLPRAKWRGRPGLNPLLTALDAAGGQTRFVGGCVRDTLLRVAVSDIDLATRLTPAEVVRRLEAAGLKAVPTGIAHGTVTAISAGLPAEVTTLRRDVSTDGRRATVAFTGDWQEDAARRDFTINALSADPATGEVYDYFGGLDDLDARRVRFIGDALTRIAEDHLRILRFFRFHARFGAGAPDAEGLAACAARANDLMALSRERIADELMKLLALQNPAATIDLMIANDILRPVLPEIDAGGAKRLWALIKRERVAKVSPDALRRLGALLPRGQETGSEIAARLRLSNAARLRLIRLNDYGATPPKDAAALAYRFGAETAIDRLLLDTELDAQAAAVAIARLAKWVRPNLPVKGAGLIARGLEPGPIVAKTLQAIEAEWVAADFATGPAFDAIVERHVAQALRSSQ